MGSNTVGNNTTMISAKLPPPLYEFVEDYRWDNRLTKSGIIILALTDWATSKGYVAPPPDEESPPKTGEPT